MSNFIVVCNKLSFIFEVQTFDECEDEVMVLKRMLNRLSGEHIRIALNLPYHMEIKNITTGEIIQIEN